MGEAWEPLGLADGGAIGLIIASLGFGWCALGGLYFVRMASGHNSSGDSADVDSATAGFGITWSAQALRKLTWSLIVLAVVYAATYLCLVLVASLFTKPEAVAMLYGFHFMIALSLGVIIRPVFAKIGQQADDRTLALMSGSMVDVTTTAALSAISLAVLNRWLGPVLVLTCVGGFVTFLACVWLRKRFRHHGLEHALLIYGIATGTFLTGMALLRAIDPDYSTTAGRNAVVAAGAEVIFAAPLLLLVLPYAVTTFSTSPWLALASTAGFLALHAVLMVVIGLYLTKKSTHSNASA
jgi:ESS family glutamate:Na+ symporter